MERDLGKDKMLREREIERNTKTGAVILEAPVPLERHPVTYGEHNMHAVNCLY